MHLKRLGSQSTQRLPSSHPQKTKFGAVVADLERTETNGNVPGSVYLDETCSVLLQSSRNF